MPSDIDNNVGGVAQEQRYRRRVDGAYKSKLARSRPLRVQLTAIYNNKDRDHSRHNNNAMRSGGRHEVQGKERLMRPQIKRLQDDMDLMI